jgi:hypothetical protein
MRWPKGAVQARLVQLAIVAVTLTTIISPAGASHTTITPNDATFGARTSPDNGKRVYLSSPRHDDSGDKGELGWDENINGRHWNYYAATGNWQNGGWNSGPFRSIRDRGYRVKVSANSEIPVQQEGWRINRDASDNWGADVHLVTHTNGGGGDYFLVMVDDATNTALDRDLRAKLDLYVGDKVPGPDKSKTDNSPYSNNKNLGELRADAPYNVYVEIIFHDTQSMVDWFGSGNNWGQSVKFDAWRYGLAIDKSLGYP